jgi:hypothetical protein
MQPLLDAIARALISYTPENFKTAFCVAEQAPAHAEVRLRYAIGSEEYPDEGTNRPSAELHDAVHALVRLYRRQKCGFPGIRVEIAQEGDGWRTRFTFLVPDAMPRGTETEREMWQAVYHARVAFFEEHFGKLPENIQKLMNLTGVWPGGGIFQIEAKDSFVTTSFGLSNVDMPTDVLPTNAQHTAHGNEMSFSATLSSRTPRWMPAERAGYGFEVAIITREPAAWALLPVSWFVQMEILKDIELLDRVEEIGAVTVEELRTGHGNETADFIVAPARAPLPESASLPNGKMRLLVATRITRDEMKFALAKGQPALLERLASAGVGHTSDLSRASVVGS